MDQDGLHFVALLILLSTMVPHHTSLLYSVHRCTHVKLWVGGVVQDAQCALFLLTKA